MTPRKEGTAAAASQNELQLHHSHVNLGPKRHQGHRRAKGGIQETPGGPGRSRGDRSGPQGQKGLTPEGPEGTRGIQETPEGPDGTAGGSGETPRGPEGTTGVRSGPQGQRCPTGAQRDWPLCLCAKAQIILLARREKG
jgi:hypothetical protein